jgi:hypothetical protein
MKNSLLQGEDDRLARGIRLDQYVVPKRLSLHWEFPTRIALRIAQNHIEARGRPLTMRGERLFGGFGL